MCKSKNYFRSDSMPSNSRNWLPLQRQQQQPLTDFPDQFRKMQIADHNSSEINTPYSDQFQYEVVYILLLLIFINLPKIIKHVCVC